jgi:hypothetical protein
VLLSSPWVRRRREHYARSCERVLSQRKGVDIDENESR